MVDVLLIQLWFSYAKQIGKSTFGICLLFVYYLQVFCQPEVCLLQKKASKVFASLKQQFQAGTVNLKAPFVFPLTSQLLYVNGKLL